MKFFGIFLAYGNIQNVFLKQSSYYAEQLSCSHEKADKYLFTK
jgi:hypothetical protein